MDEVEEVFQSIHEKFNHICEDKAVEGPEDMQLREALKVNVVEAKALLEGPLEGPLAKGIRDCEQYA